tara:strand:- start:324 stop:584 length:261 start_codon:yes stop_codon:yes gene_type:complete
MDIYTIIINDPVYFTIFVLITLMVLFSLIKKYAKFILTSIAIFILYIGYVWYNENQIPKKSSDFKEQVLKDSKLMLNSAKKIITTD